MLTQISERSIITLLKQNNDREIEMRISIPVKEITLTAIKNKGVEQVRKEAQYIADECFASKNSVLNWVRKFEKGEVSIQ